MITGSLRIWSRDEPGEAAADGQPMSHQSAANAPLQDGLATNGGAAGAPAPADDRVREMLRGINTSAAYEPAMAANDTVSTPDDRRTVIVPASPALSPEAPIASSRDPRLQSLGQGFRAPQRATP
jgi:hypothetical protein